MIEKNWRILIVFQLLLNDLGYQLLTTINLVAVYIVSFHKHYDIFSITKHGAQNSELMKSVLENINNYDNKDILILAPDSHDKTFLKQLQNKPTELIRSQQYD